MMVFLAVLLILLLRLDAIKCLDVTSSRCDVWCVTRDCVTGWWRDGGRLHPGVTQRRREPVCASGLMWVTQWLHAPCLSMISLLSWMLYPGIESLQCPGTQWDYSERACDQVLMLQMPSSFPPSARALLLPQSFRLAIVIISFSPAMHLVHLH